MVTDFNLNTRINDIFFLKNVEFRVRRDNKTIDMFFKIADKTGEIEAVNRDISDDKVEKLGKIEFAQVEGYITKKKSDGTLQATVSSLSKAVPLDLNYSPFVFLPKHITPLQIFFIQKWFYTCILFLSFFSFF